MKIFTILTVNPHGDGYTHFYFNSQLIVQGDYYHDKIEDYFKGFIDGYKYTLNDVKVINIGYEKDEWEYEDFSAEEFLEDTIKRLEKDGFTRVKDE